METRSIEKELLELENKYWQAIQDADADTAARLSDDPCILAGASGVASIGRKELAAMMKSAGYTLDRYELRDPKVRLVADDVAVLAYQVHEDLTVDGKPVQLDTADASTWVRRDGAWVCALHTEAIAGDPFGRDRQITG